VKTIASAFAGIVSSFVVTAIGAAMSLALLDTRPAMAAEIDQAAWDSLKQSETLANGQRIAWVEMGPEGAPPLILLHGYTDTSRAWSLMAPELAKTRRLYMLDLRGHGASAAPECCYALANFAYDLKLFMEERGIERAAIGGHSFGSLIATRFAAEYPERVERLLLFGTTTATVVAHGTPVPEGVRSLTEPLDPATNEFLAAWLAQFDLPAIDREFARHARADTLAVPFVTWRAVMDELTDSSTARYAARITAPVLNVSGGRDEFFGPEHQAALRASFPDGEYRLYPDLGHNMIYEAPDEIMPAVLRFLASPDRRR
jgi:pimeloyl-ACP methyl ester carboxylesterase